MTTFHLRQSERGRCVHRKTGADALQNHVTNRTTKMHSYFHEARKIWCNHFQRALQERVNEWSFYTREALPLVRTRILRLAQISPIIARSPARRPGDEREISGKTSAGVSCAISAQLPGNGRAAATATPPNVHQVGSQDNSHCTGNGRAMAAPETCETTRNTVTQLPRHNRAAVGVTSRKTTRSNLNHDIQKL